MNLSEIRKKKLELRKKIQEARTEGELEDIKEELIALQEAERLLEEKVSALESEKDDKDTPPKTEEETPNEEGEETDEQELVNEKSLIKNSVAKPEARKLENLKKIKKVEERKMEEKNILETAEYRSAFLKRLQGKPLNEEEQRAMTTAQESVGSTIPTTTLNRIEEKLRQTSALFNQVEVLNIPGYLSIPQEKITNEASWVAENTASDDVDDTTDAINFGAYKLIRTISITAEVEAMSIDAFETYIVKKLSDKMAIAIENAILNGNGKGQPKGILQETLEKVEYSKGGTPTYANLCSLMAKLKSGYKPNSKFVMSSKMLWENIATITVGNQLVFLPDPTGEFAGRIFGRPVIEDDYISDKKILLGNFEKYTINFNKAIEVTSDESVEFRKGNKVYRALGLLDGKTVNTEAFVLLDESAEETLAV